MERPTTTWQPIERTVTGEILYLDELHAAGDQGNKSFYDIDATEQRKYEAAAKHLDEAAERPKILDQFERYDTPLTDAKASCLALADALYELKGDSPLTSVDIVLEGSPESILIKLQQTRAATILTTDNEQLAIESDGSHYPILDIKKQDAKLIGASLRVWGWNDGKFTRTNQVDEKYSYSEHLLQYPQAEKQMTRTLEIRFNYKSPTGESFTESIDQMLTSRGGASIGRSVFIAKYAETGYDGHHTASLHNVSDDDIEEFADVCADIVGDAPESYGDYQVRELKEYTERVVTPEAAEAVTRLIDSTWPAQATYILTRVTEGKRIARLLLDESTVSEGVALIDSYLTQSV